MLYDYQCKKCNHFAAICSLCQQPVRGLMHWCPICGHGSHLDCSKLWFANSFVCPSGCGHNCCDPNTERIVDVDGSK